MSSKLISGLLALSLTASAAALAQAPAPAKPVPQATDFSALDKNKDGFVTSAEAEPAGALHDVFASLDTNQDGRLSPTEFAAWSGADKSRTPALVSPATGPSGSGGAQHMPGTHK